MGGDVNLRDIIDEVMSLIQDNAFDELADRYANIMKDIDNVTSAEINAWLRMAWQFRNGISNWYDLRDLAAQTYEKRGEDVKGLMMGFGDLKRPTRVLDKVQYVGNRHVHLDTLSVYRAYEGKSIILPGLTGLAPTNKLQAIKYNQMALVSLRKGYYHDKMWTFSVKDVKDKYPDDNT
jgi:hypothetical protein